MYGRFLYGWPSTPGYHPLTNEVSEVEPEFQSALTALVRLPSEDADGTFAPQDVRLSEGAFEKFEQRERHWYVKGETQVLRLAGTLAYIARAISLGAYMSDDVEGITSALEPKEIAEQFMITSIRLWLESFWPHARAALRQIGLSERHANARRVLRWIKAHGKNAVSREEIRREALGQCLDADQTQILIDGLVKAGCVRSRNWQDHRADAQPVSDTQIQFSSSMRKLRKRSANPGFRSLRST